MQISESNWLAQQWAAKGSPPCDHPHIEKEYGGSMHFDYACTTCGGSGPEIRQIRDQRYEQSRSEGRAPRS